MSNDTSLDEALLHFMKHASPMFISGVIFRYDGDSIRMIIGQRMGEDFIFSGHIVMTTQLLEYLVVSSGEMLQAVAKAKAASIRGEGTLQ